VFFRICIFCHPKDQGVNKYPHGGDMACRLIYEMDERNLCQVMLLCLFVCFFVFWFCLHICLFVLVISFFLASAGWLAAGGGGGACCCCC
jgi:hypothetical protein